MQGQWRPSGLSGVPFAHALVNGGGLVGWYGSSGAVMQNYDNTGTAVWLGTASWSRRWRYRSAPSSFNFGRRLPGGIPQTTREHQFHTSLNVTAMAIHWAAPQWQDQATAFSRSIRHWDQGYPAIGYFGSLGVRFDSFLQRRANGTFAWGINGSDFDFSKPIETYTSIA